MKAVVVGGETRIGSEDGQAGGREHGHQRTKRSESLNEREGDLRGRSVGMRRNELDGTGVRVYGVDVDAQQVANAGRDADNLAQRRRRHHNRIPDARVICVPHAPEKLAERGVDVESGAIPSVTLRLSPKPLPAALAAPRTPRATGPPATTFPTTGSELMTRLRSAGRPAWRHQARTMPPTSSPEPRWVPSTGPTCVQNSGPAPKIAVPRATRWSASSTDWACCTIQSVAPRSCSSSR